VHELFGNQGHTTDEEPPLLQIGEPGRDAIVTNTRMYQVHSLEGSESSTLRGSLVRTVQQDERYGRHTLASPHSDSPHDTDMTTTTYAFLTLLIRREFLSSKPLVTNTVDQIVDSFLFPVVKHGLYALPVYSDSLCIHGQYGAGEVPRPSNCCRTLPTVPILPKVSARQSREKVDVQSRGPKTDGVLS